MKLQQLRYIVEVVNHKLNVSSTAEGIYTSQPGISKQVRLLEDELGIQIFTRNGKLLTEITPAGKEIVRIARDVLNQVEAIRSIADEFTRPDKGVLRIGTTHVQMCYILPDIIKTFTARYPHVTVRIQQGSLAEIMDALLKGAVDFVMTEEVFPQQNELMSLPCYLWNRNVIVPAGHPLADKKNVTLDDLATFPLVTYSEDLNIREDIDAAFENANLTPKIALTATDADVIKTYVRLGMGVGIITSMALDLEKDKDLICVGTPDLFNQGKTSLGFKKSIFLRNYMYDFIHNIAPHLSQECVDKALALGASESIDAIFSDMTLPIK